MADFHDITLAYAGICQAAALVQQFAQEGTADREMFRHSLRSLLVTQPPTTLSVFGSSLQNVELGIETALSQAGNGRGGKIDGEISRYWISLIVLSKKLNRNSEAKQQLAQRLQQVERQLSLYDNNVLADQMVANLAAIYSDVISPLGKKIHVMGAQDYLVRPDIQNKIRATLLAGIRASILWEQVGGSRWQFMFSRKKILDQLKKFYQAIE